MRPEEWSRVKEVLAAVLPLPAESRPAYLLDACAGDDALRQQVEKLLISHEQANSFLETAAQLSQGISTRRSLEGRRIGPYEVRSHIGAGGMGDVYKARDTRLDRTVAIKVLPPQVATDPVARDRFEREARAVAALNHPHICTLHDIGIQDGIDFLVMEFLEGETLAARLQRGALNVSDALNYGIQIASALDKVHRAGIVHRDLKPGNVMVTKAGAKLLDFGLSKAGVSAVVAAHPLASPSLELTSAGMILGTVQYMAPEQTEGKRADARSDIFAFGAMLYEMLSGNKAFRGDSYSSLMAAIREQEPPTLPRVSPTLDRTIRTCLAKDPDDRWQTARDLLRELKWVADAGPESGGPALAGSLRRTRTVAWSSAAIALVTTSAFALLGYVYLNRPAPAHLPALFEVQTPATSDPMSIALSADGKQLAFVATADGVPKLWIRPLDQVNAQTLIGTEGASYPFWAPDGRSIAFFAEGKLKRLDVSGGAPQVVADAPTGRGGSWGRDGIIVFAPTTASALMRVPATGGTPAPATTFSAGQASHRWPYFLPDGRRFLFLATLGQPDSLRGVFMGALDSTEVTRVLEDHTPAIYVSSGKLLFVREGALVAMDFDPDRGVVSGDPTRIIQPIGFDASYSHWALALSENGVLAHRTAIAEPRQLVWVDRKGQVVGQLGAVDDSAIASPELTRDGRRVAVLRAREGNPDVWLIDVSRGVPSRFTFDPDVDGYAIWAPDASRVVFASRRKGQFGMFERPVAGTGDDRHVGTSELTIPLDFSPEGGVLLFAVQTRQTGVDMWGLSSADNGTPFPVMQTRFDEMSGQFSPSGRSIAYQSNASGRMEIYVAPFRGSGEQQQVSTAGGSQPRWSSDGKELFYVARDGRMMAVATRVNSAGRLDADVPVPLFLTRLATGANIAAAVASKPQYDVAPDGRFLMNVSVEGAAAPPITITLNWQTALTK
jgi:serine/threonine protein kinase/Tol biopolymer transport system component